MDAMKILPHFKGTVVHDDFSSYWKYEDCHHALCNAHILREVTAIHAFEIHAFEKEKWASDMKALLLQIKEECGNIS